MDDRRANLALLWWVKFIAIAIPLLVVTAAIAYGLMSRH